MRWFNSANGLSITFIALLFTACNTHVVKTDNLNVRSAPTKNAKVIGQLHYNDRVKVTPHNDAWGQIEFEDKTGYVAMKHMITTKENFKSNCEMAGLILVLALFGLGGGGAAVAVGKLKKDGTPDMRYKANR